MYSSITYMHYKCTLYGNDALKIIKVAQNMMFYVIQTKYSVLLTKQFLQSIYAAIVISLMLWLYFRLITNILIIHCAFTIDVKPIELREVVS